MKNKKVNKNRNKNPTPDAGIYSIRCAICNKPYIRETFIPLKKRGFMNINKLTYKNDTSYALVLHRKYNFDLKGAKTIRHIPDKKKRLAIESVVILFTETIKQRSGKFQLSPTLAQLIIMKHKLNNYVKSKTNATLLPTKT